MPSITRKLRMERRQLDYRSLRCVFTQERNIPSTLFMLVPRNEHSDIWCRRTLKGYRGNATTNITPRRYQDKKKYYEVPPAFGLCLVRKTHIMPSITRKLRMDWRQLEYRPLQCVFTQERNIPLTLFMLVPRNVHSDMWGRRTL